MSYEQYFRRGVGGRWSLVVGRKPVDETVSEGESCGGDSAWFMGEGIEFVGEVAEAPSVLIYCKYKKKILLPRVQEQVPFLLAMRRSRRSRPREDA